MTMIQHTESVVRLPYAPPSASRPVRAQDPRSEVGGRRVLVVEDDADGAQALADLMRLTGYTVEVAYDGVTAIEKAWASRPDIVLCDIGLPGMNGYDVARELRALGGEAMRIIALTGDVQPEDVRRALEAGFDAHVAKPCDFERIEQLLG